MFPIYNFYCTLPPHSRVTPKTHALPHHSRVYPQTHALSPHSRVTPTLTRVPQDKEYLKKECETYRLSNVKLEGRLQKMEAKLSPDSSGLINRINELEEATEVRKFFPSDFYVFVL